MMECGDVDQELLFWPKDYAAFECAFDSLTHSFELNIGRIAPGKSPRQCIVKSNSISDIRCFNEEDLGAGFNYVLRTIAHARNLYQQSITTYLRNTKAEDLVFYMDNQKISIGEHKEDKNMFPRKDAVKKEEEIKEAVEVYERGEAGSHERAIVDLERVEPGECFRIVDSERKVMMVVNAPAKEKGSKLVPVLDFTTASVKYLTPTTRVWVYRKVGTQIVVDSFVMDYELD